MRLNPIPGPIRCLNLIVLLSLAGFQSTVRAQLVTPEPVHAASILVGGGLGDDFAAMHLVLGLEWAGERGLQLWKVMPPPGVIPATIIPAAVGQISGEADGGFWRSLGLLQLGHGYGAFEFFNGSTVPNLVDILIDQARDRRPIEDAESASYLYMLSMAGRTDLEAFERQKGPVPNRNDLMNRPAQWRGKVVKLQGRVRRLRALPPDAELQKFGIGPIYEAWVFQDQYGAHPVCLLVTSLPTGLKPAEDLDEEVSFAGFFYKVYRYASAQTKEGDRVLRDAPLLMGPGLRLRPKSKAEGPDPGAWTRDLLPIFFSVIIGTVGLGGFMGWWLSRSDKKARARLREVQDRTGGSREGPPGEWGPDNPFPFVGGNGTGTGNRPS